MRISTAGLLSALLSGSSALAATPFISELYVDPPGGDGDRLQEFLEISGASGQAIGSLFLLQIENENNDFGTGNQGRVDLGFDLSGQTLGANGRLVIASANGNPAANGRPAHVFDPASTLLQGTVDFGGYFGVPGLLTDQPTNDAVRTENSGGTYLLIDIGAGPAPVIGQDFDTNDDGVLDLPASYAVLDAVGVAAESSELDFGGLYGFTNFSSGPLQPGVDVAPGSTVIDAGFEVEYLSREANSGEWFVANLTDGPNAARGGPDVPIVGAQYVISAQDTPAGDQTGDEEVSIALPCGLSPLTPGRRTDVVRGLRGDYNQSGALDASDIDALFAGRGDLTAANSGFDLTPTAGVVDIDDAAVWVEQLAGTAFGDANLDGDVDVFQFDGGGDAQILTSNLGATAGAGWANGDFNGDGDVDVFQFDGGGDAQILTSNLGFGSDAVSSLTAALALEADLSSAMAASGKYDPSTGKIVIEIGSGVGVVGLESLTGGDLVPTNLTDALAAAQATSDTIAFFSASGLPTGVFALGAIVKPGTSVGELGFGFTPLGGSLTTVALEVVPEPTTLALLGMGGVALLGRRRMCE